MENKKLYSSKLESMSVDELKSVLERQDLPPKLEKEVREALASVLQREKISAPMFEKSRSQYDDIIKQLMNTVKNSPKGDIARKEAIDQLGIEDEEDMITRFSKRKLDGGATESMDMIPEPLSPKADDIPFSKPTWAEGTGTRTKAGMRHAARRMEKEGADMSDYLKGVESWEQMGVLGEKPMDKSISKMVDASYMTDVLPEMGQKAAERIASQSGKTSAKEMAIKALSKLAGAATSPVGMAAQEFLIPGDMGTPKEDLTAEELQVEYPELAQSMGEFKQKDEEKLRLQKVREQVLKNILKPTL